MSTSTDPEASPALSDSDWGRRSLRELTSYIRRKHHDFTRAAFAHLRGPLEDAVRQHATARPELATVRKLFDELEGDMLPHMMREERFVFPYIDKIDGVRSGNEAPHAAFGSIESPARMMMIEHQHDDGVLELLRSLTDRYVPHAGATPALVTLYEGLRALDEDLCEHMRLENDVLFPRAIAEERALSAR
jgi:regulator of cell morphogenesis and NO signaling